MILFWNTVASNLFIVTPKIHFVKFDQLSPVFIPETILHGVYFVQFTRAFYVTE